MVSNDKTFTHVEDSMKERKWKSLKKLMKSQNNRVKCSKKTSQVESEEKTKNSKENEKIFSLPASSAVSPAHWKRKTMESNPLSEEENGHTELPVKKMKWKSMKMLMKNQKKTIKCSKKTSQIQGRKKTQNAKQSDLKIVKKARNREESLVTSTKRSTTTRKRNTIERYSSLWTSAPQAARKPVTLEKGKGTRLKDIPNVAYKLAQSNYDDNMQILHTILFGKRSKVHAAKNIGLFSGYVWGEDEEKRRSKVKERIDKCVKDKLLELCDILNIPIRNKSSTRKGDISAKILYFLEFPRATTESSIANKGVKKRMSLSSKCRDYSENEENESNDGMSEDSNESYDSDESDPDAWYNYKYGRHEYPDVPDDLWETDPDEAWHLYKYGRRVFTTW